MQSRINKYSNSEETTSLSRSQKNAKLYTEISEYNVDNFDVNSNTTVIGENEKTIDIDKLRDMLDKKYRVEPRKSRPIAKIDDTLTDNEINLDETREYDINAVLNKVKEEKEPDYEVDRLKKLRNTQVDILNDLNIDTKEDDINKAVSTKEGEKLKDLIDTINLTEELNATKKEVDPLDILSDLKGNDEETKIMSIKELEEAKQKDEEEDIIQEKTKEVENKEDSVINEENLINETFSASTLINNLDLEEIAKQDDEEKAIDKKIDSKKKKNKSLENSFYTTSSILKQSDFDDFSDLKDDLSVTKIIIRILIIIIIIGFIAGVFFLLNKMLNWGLF